MSVEADVEIARRRVVRLLDKVRWLRTNRSLGTYWINVHPDGIRAKRSWKRRGDRNAVGLGTYSVIVLDPTSVSPTIPARWPVYVLWNEDRGLTPDGARRLSSFSEDFTMPKGLSFDEAGSVTDAPSRRS